MSAPGSEIVFTYIHAATFGAGAEAFRGRFADVQARVTAIGEPSSAGFDPATLAEELRGVGFDLLEDLGRGVVPRYDPQGLDGLVGGGSAASREPASRSARRDPFGDALHHLRLDSVVAVVGASLARRP